MVRHRPKLRRISLWLVPRSNRAISLLPAGCLNVRQRVTRALLYSYSPKRTIPRYWPGGGYLGSSRTLRRQEPCTKRLKRVEFKAPKNACSPSENEVSYVCCYADKEEGTPASDNNAAAGGSTLVISPPPKLRKEPDPSLGCYAAARGSKWRALTRYAAVDAMSLSVCSQHETSSFPRARDEDRQPPLLLRSYQCRGKAAE